MGNQILELRKNLSSKLDPMRYEHSLSVSFTAMALAMRYGADLEKAELAGLLHDCAKRYSDAEIIKKCEKQGIALTTEELASASVLHAGYGACIAERKYKITDPEILGAIRWHTTGKPNMTVLEEILYTADYIEPRRYKAENLPEIRKLAFTDLSDAVRRILGDTVRYLRQKGSVIHPLTLEAYEYYQSLYKERKGV